jgi:hypothetical protein
LHARESILDQHNPTTHIIYHLQQFCDIKFTEPIFIPQWVEKLLKRTQPNPARREGEGRREGERRARKKRSKEGRNEGREAEANCRNQVGISNYSSTSAGSWCMDAWEESTMSIPQSSFPRPHRSTFHLHQPLILLLLSASLYAMWLLKRRSLSLSAHALYHIDYGIDIIHEEPYYSS